MFNLMVIVDSLRVRKRRSRTRSNDVAMTASYLNSHPVRCLHIGAGSHPLQGWLNSDVEQGRERRIELDATQRFPLADDTFDFIFSEHMIEHISHADGRSMMHECFRVLKPGGTVRITTPDIRFLAALLDGELDATQQAYLAWSRDAFLPEATGSAANFVVNNFFRDWGHQFIYDAPTLCNIFVQCGFEAIVRRDICVSDHRELAQLENVDRMPLGFLALESMTFEGSKPTPYDATHRAFAGP